MRRYIQVDVINILQQHVIVGDMVEIVLNTHEGCIKAFICDEDFKRLQRNDFFIEPAELPTGILATSETFVIE